MTDDEIMKLWRQHYEVLGFAHALMEKMKQEPQREPVAYIATNALGLKFFARAGLMTFTTLCLCTT